MQDLGNLLSGQKQDFHEHASHTTWNALDTSGKQNPNVKNEQLHEGQQLDLKFGGAYMKLGIWDPNFGVQNGNAKGPHVAKQMR